MTALQVQASLNLFKIVLRRWLMSLLLDFKKLKAASLTPLNADFVQANTRTACLGMCFNLTDHCKKLMHMTIAYVNAFS